MSNKSEKIDLLAKALCKAQGELRGAVKDSANPFFKSKYADLESVWSVCKEPLQNNGLSIAQLFSTGQDGPEMVTVLMHESGQWLEGRQPLLAKAANPQELGSAATYSRRYGLAAMLGVIQVDDDAETAMKRPMTSGKPAQSNQNNVSRVNLQSAIEPANNFAKSGGGAVTPNHYNKSAPAPGDLDAINKELSAASDAVQDIFGAAPEHVDFGEMDTPPSAPSDEPPEHCGKKMYISKYVDKNMGPNPPWYCSTCKHKIAR